MTRLQRRSCGGALFLLFCCAPVAAQDSTFLRPGTAAGEGGGGLPFCVTTASGGTECAFNASCDDLTACVQDSDCPSGFVCVVNTCCDEPPGPSVCLAPTGSGFVCNATGPFTCEGGDAFFPECALAAAPAPALSRPVLGFGALLLAGVGVLALRAVRRQA